MNFPLHFKTKGEFAHVQLREVNHANSKKKVNRASSAKKH
jgi:hypothetical protein